MSDNQDSIGNAWRFSGEIIAIVSKVTKKNKAFHEIVASRKDGDYQRLCVCTKWGALDSDVVRGADVTMCGRIDGREYNGKHYAGLTALQIEVHGVRANDVPEEPKDENTAAEQESLPF